MSLLKKARNLLEQSLFRVYASIQENKDKPTPKDAPLITSQGPTTDRKWMLTGNQLQDHRQVITTLQEIVRIKENFSEDYLNAKLSHIFHELAVAEPEKIALKILSLIDTLEKEFESDIDQEWEVIFPLEFIRISDDAGNFSVGEFAIGLTKIYRFTKDIENAWVSRTSIPFHFTVLDNYLNKICADMNVIAGEPNRALEKAYLLLSDSLSALKLYAPWMKVDAEGKTSKHASYVRIINLKKKTMQTHSFSGAQVFSNAPLYPSFYQLMVKEGLATINEFYCSQDKNTFKDQVLDSLHWLGSALKDADDRDKFIKLVICLEALLKKENEREEITKTLSERLALLISPNFDERVGTFQHMKRLYNIRSEIIHKGRRNVNENDILQLTSYVCGAIIAAVNAYLPGMSFDEFIEKLDKTKFRSSETFKDFVKIDKPF